MSYNSNNNHDSKWHVRALQILVLVSVIAFSILSFRQADKVGDLEAQLAKYKGTDLASVKTRECAQDLRCMSYNPSTNVWLWKPGLEPYNAPRVDRDGQPPEKLPVPKE